MIGFERGSFLSGWSSVVYFRFCFVFSVVCAVFFFGRGKFSGIVVVFYWVFRELEVIG